MAEIKEYNISINFKLSDPRAELFNALKFYEKKPEIFKKIAKLFSSKEYKSSQFFKLALDHEWKSFITKFGEDRDITWQKQALTEMVKNHLDIQFLFDDTELTSFLLKQTSNAEKIYPYLCYVNILSNGIEKQQNLDFIDKKIALKNSKKVETFIIYQNLLLKNYFKKENRKKIIDYSIQENFTTPEELFFSGLKEKVEVAEIVAESYPLELNSLPNNEKLKNALKDFKAVGVNYPGSDIEEKILSKILDNLDNLFLGGDRLFNILDLIKANDRNIQRIIDKFNVFEKNGRNGTQSIAGVVLVKDLDQFISFFDQMINTDPDKTIVFFKKMHQVLQFAKAYSSSYEKGDDNDYKNFDKEQMDFLNRGQGITDLNQKRQYIENVLLKWENKNSNFLLKKKL